MADITFTAVTGADGVLKFTPNGAAVYELRVCDSKSKKLDNGDWETISEQWLNVTAWGKFAEYLATLDITKGMRVKVVGEFYVRDFEHNGEKRQSLDVKAWGVDVFQKRTGQGQTRTQPTRQQQPAADPWGANQRETQADPWGRGQTNSEPAPF